MAAAVRSRERGRKIHNIRCRISEREKEPERERGRNLTSSFIAQDSVEQFAVEQKSIIHYNAMRAYEGIAADRVADQLILKRRKGRLL